MKIFKLSLVMILMIVPLFLKAQINGDTPPFVLTNAQLKSWTVTGSTADAKNIVSVPLLEKFEQNNTQLNTDLSNDMRVMYAPDGMNNFGNYLSETSVFNLYNFTHWQYIDQLIWFGGTASQPVLIPAAPWVNAAHRNGVKVYGNVFFAPNVFGGSPEAVAEFLEKDSTGSFIAAQKLNAIVNYYGFDGWFINMETNVDSTIAQLMLDFVKELKSTLSEDKEVIWYDSMLLDGRVRWQNYLSDNNKVFLQDGDTRVSDGMFINFFWRGSLGPTLSRQTAQSISRSEFDAYSGVDLWPTRNQFPFDDGGNSWMEALHEDNNPITSLALFVPDVIFRNDRYSNFRSDANEADRFYSAEEWLFSGEDRNPVFSDETGFKGLSNWVPATSVINDLPFETGFNTGQGKAKFKNGSKVSSVGWHNMDAQDVLPTWQFAFEGNSDLAAKFTFDDAFFGGSSIEVAGDLASGGQTTMKLYKTNLAIQKRSKVDLTFKLDSAGETHMSLALVFDDNVSEVVTLGIGEASGEGWNTKTVDLGAYANRKLVTIGLQFASTDAVSNYMVKLGKLRIYNQGEPIPAPVADFAATATNIIVGQKVGFADLSSNDPKFRLWYFEGGKPHISFAENPVIKYNNVGTYKVVLKVFNKQGFDIETRTEYITVSPVPTQIDHTDPVGTGIITARAEISRDEGAPKAFDNMFTAAGGTKWLDNAGVPSVTDPSWIQIQLPEPKTTNTLVIVSANDAPERDPADFVLLGSNDGETFTTIGSWTGEVFTERYQLREFPINNTTAYTYYRLEITKNNGDNSLTQLAEIQLLEPITSAGIAPEADFTASHTTVKVGQRIRFTDLSVFEPTSWSWTFEGASRSTSKARNPRVTYYRPGIYEVSLTVSNSQGSDTKTKTDFIIVEPYHFKDKYAAFADKSAESIAFEDELEEGGEEIFYPNPVKEVLYFKGNIDEGTQVEILNSRGEQVRQIDTAQNAEISVDQLPEGVYFVRLLNGEGAGKIFKLIIEK